LPRIVKLLTALSASTDRTKLSLSQAILGSPRPLNITEWELQRIRRVHPWASPKIALQIAIDHRRFRTTSKEGKREYMKLYMRDRRRQGK
jgi:hypothetical protein